MSTDREALMREGDDVLRLIEADASMMSVLRTVATLRLPDWWIGAGFVRNRVWSELHGRPSSVESDDIDLVYFDPGAVLATHDQALEEKLRGLRPELAWSVKNQARMHLRNGDPPYASTFDAISKWPETATAVAVTMRVDGALALCAPHGTADLRGMVIRPTPSMRPKMDVFLHRASDKAWTLRWPLVRIETFCHRG